ncbi:GNAT family N-acetyltransferase [Flavobacterium sp. XGLA_31]|uniref:GNAT family N-acetyltransferase n=1 Tax=Flavobacterium sp. XGLA_31 TaxID=3447666 RepID=UPI003F3E4D23
MITFKTLENVPIKVILDTFNLAFSDYIVPMRITEAQLLAKIKTENLQLQYSAGAFENEELIAFILHGHDFIQGKSVVYNGGTGVIPSKRGQNLTEQLYEFIIPSLRAKQIDSVQLEVITTNIPAIKTYEKAGFKTMRVLDCFKGVLSQEPTDNTYIIQTVTTWDWALFISFWDWQPSWQNQVSAIEKSKNDLVCLGIYQEKELLGYLLLNTQSNRIQQFAVTKNHRHQGIATALFKYTAGHYSSELTLINIDHSSENTIQFLEKMGFHKTVSQYEMWLTL